MQKGKHGKEEMAKSWKLHFLLFGSPLQVRFHETWKSGNAEIWKSGNTRDKNMCFKRIILQVSQYLDFYTRRFQYIANLARPKLI